MTMRVFVAAVLTLVAARASFADPLKCDVSQYKATTGLTANVEQDLLAVSWAGQGGAELRARYAIEGGQPVVRELAIRKSGGQWTMLGQNLTAEYRVVTGVRRMSEQQAEPLRAAGVELTPEVITKNRWYAFWDAPLVMPGGPEIQARRAQRGRGAAPSAPRVLGGPRTPSEIRRATASFQTASCAVKTDGASLAVTFPGLSMGTFAGSLRFTAYRGTNLIRMDAVAKTEEPWVAYKYDAGLKGLSTDLLSNVSWHDTCGHVHHYSFGGVKNETIVPLKAANRVLVAGGKGGSLATFTPPHTFF